METNKAICGNRDAKTPQLYVSHLLCFAIFTLLINAWRQIERGKIISNTKVFLMENKKLAVSFVFTSTLNHCTLARCQAVIKKKNYYKYNNCFLLGQLKSTFRSQRQLAPAIGEFSVRRVLRSEGLYGSQ